MRQKASIAIAEIFLKSVKILFVEVTSRFTIQDFKILRKSNCCECVPVFGSCVWETTAVDQKSGATI